MWAGERQHFWQRFFTRKRSDTLERPPVCIHVHEPGTVFIRDPECAVADRHEPLTVETIRVGSKLASLQVHRDLPGVSAARMGRPRNLPSLPVLELDHVDEYELVALELEPADLR